MPQRNEGGAALLALMVVLASAAAIAGAWALRRHASPVPRWQVQGRHLALALAAVQGQAFLRHCLNRSMPSVQLLPCPDASGNEGVADALCPGLSQGWLPWKTLGVPPLRDASGTCLWYERNGISARVIAAGSPRAGQSRTALASRPLCGGNNAPGNYIAAGDVAVAVTLDTALMTARCP
jgi:hypothetical protein